MRLKLGVCCFKQERLERIVGQLDRGTGMATGMGSLRGVGQVGQGRWSRSYLFSNDCLSAQRTAMRPVSL